MLGINSRPDALQAAVLQVKLKYLDNWSEKRRQNAARYDNLFARAGLEEVITPVTLPNRRHIFNQYTIRCSRRDDLMEYLREEGVGCEIYYPVPLHLQECFGDLGYGEGDLPATERVALESLSIPIYPELTPEMQELVVDKITAFYHRAIR